MSDIVNKLWGLCHTLRHAGIDSSDYIEQLTYLLFLKMADESGIELPQGHDWNGLRQRSNGALIDYYTVLLQRMAEQGGLLGDIFQGSESRLTDPADLRKLIVLIDAQTWSQMGVDVQGAAFEGLLEKAASAGKKGAGQYFTPRPLVESVCRVMKPDPRAHSQWMLCDPACGTGGFLTGAHSWLQHELQAETGYKGAKRLKGKLNPKTAIRSKTYYGQELVQRPRRLALMNAFLHGFEAQIHLGDTIYEPPRGTQFDCILTNPPFGNRGANQAPMRDDFPIRTSNKQLNFVQHVVNVLKPEGRAAMVLPDNCLFEGKAGPVFEWLMRQCNLHTILRLPLGTFASYAPGIRANVIFFQKGRPTRETWIYDARVDVPLVTKKNHPLSHTHFVGFETAYGSDANGDSPRRENDSQDRFKCFSVDDVRRRGYKLNINWLDDGNFVNGNDLCAPQDLAVEIIKELEAGVDKLKELILLMESASTSEFMTPNTEQIKSTKQTKNPQSIKTTRNMRRTRSVSGT